METKFYANYDHDKDQFRVIRSDQLTFPEITSVLLKCLPRPRLGVLQVPLVISALGKHTRPY